MANLGNSKRTCRIREQTFYFTGPRQVVSRAAVAMLREGKYVVEGPSVVISQCPEITVRMAIYDGPDIVRTDALRYGFLHRRPQSQRRVVPRCHSTS